MWMTSWSAHSRSSRRSSGEIFFPRARFSFLIRAHRRAVLAKNHGRPQSLMHTAFAGDVIFSARAARTLHWVRCAATARTSRENFRREVEKNIDENFPSHYLSANKRDNQSAEHKNFRDPLLRTERGDCRWRLRNLQKKPRPRNLLQKKPAAKKAPAKAAPKKKAAAKKKK